MYERILRTFNFLVNFILNILIKCILIKKGVYFLKNYSRTINERFKTEFIIERIKFILKKQHFPVQW